VRQRVGHDSVVRHEDSTVVLRMDFQKRTVDTLAWLGTGAFTVTTYTGSGGWQTSSSRDLFPFIDNAIATSDGAVGIFRAREYRFDWIAPDGSRSRGVRLPYPWSAITDNNRQQFLDSINTARMKAYDGAMARRAADSIRNGGVPTYPSTSSVNGIERITQVPVPPPTRPQPILPEDIPDFLPPTAGGDLLADADGHVWIRPIQRPPISDFALYDVVSRSEGLIERVRVPVNRFIVGFAPGGFVFLSARDGGVATIEKVRVR
jgi:hypothetical protein